MLDQDKQREFALAVVKKLRDAGYESLWAGGCVRDQLLGKKPKDYDVATSARPDQVRELFGYRRTLSIGASFGVISVLADRKCDPIEVATFRSDGAYIDGRHPQEVVFTSAEEDALRRDFTINGLFLDPVTDEVIDYIEGQLDLKKGIIRAIGNPMERFAEDKLRMLRAVRFASSLGFEIEPKTFTAIQAMSNDIELVSSERIGSELARLFTHSNRKSGLVLLQESGLLNILIPEIASVYSEDRNSWESTTESYSLLNLSSLSASMAILLLPLNDSSKIGEICRRFRFTNKEIDRTNWLVDNFPIIKSAKTIPWPQLQRCLIHPGCEELIAMAKSLLGTSHEGIQECNVRLQLPSEKLNPSHLVTGDELIEHGLKPGPHFGKLLETIRDAQLNGEISSLAEALQFADKWICNKNLNSNR